MQEKLCIDLPGHINNSCSICKHVLPTGRQEYYSFGIISVLLRFDLYQCVKLFDAGQYDLLETFPLLL